MNIKTGRLIIKPYADSDREDMLRLLTDDLIRENYMLPDFPDEEALHRMFQRLKELSLSEEHCEAGIYLEGELIGFVNDVAVRGNTMELGYVIAPAFQNHGYAAEALGGVMEELFRQGFREITAAAFEDNIPSIRVMEKCGMSRIARREDVEYRGRKRRCAYYSRKNPGNPAGNGGKGFETCEG